MKTNKLFNDFYIDSSNDEPTTWFIEGWCSSTDESDIVATIDIYGNIHWEGDYMEIYADNDKFKQALEVFYDSHWFNDKDNLIDKISQHIKHFDFADFNVIHNDGNCLYAINRIDALNTYFWAYGLVNTESVVFTPHTKNKVDLKNIATYLVNDIITAIGTETFCIECD